ncbi:1-aminocyclopropane-1-carboxylate deaminase/D-cysteine desulfhydrase [Paenactinomyces guangxiensis]|uniref:D-cysteine desulfhydrase family protein n=1 Tax=Paenactinomyces guangxiensis TaxID=1490290 RepID=A0A7W1WR05_9BACL|nr:D-cysteine desulfhydrase family protein [Paenactinomyces guangxiensis]MBA4494484.1 D-cysteine desulfhydrase family protein [Paenactinomyces guangxiensis]MBH8591461.1 D-cysteine desulfhydrase family protein [Paenactinomyces guangxiensis]
MCSSFPRFPILWGETPLQPLHRFAEKLGVASCWIKRDDLTGIAFGGNKLRKLEFLLGRALKEGCDLIITGGSPQSNHARLTAAAANRAGLETWLCFAGKRLGEIQGNLLLDQLLNARLFLTGQYGSDGLLRAMEEKAEEARNLGRKPYIIPVGGSTSIGDYGYLKAWQELESQRERAEIPPFDEIYVAVGTGGTLAGLLTGHTLSRSPSRIIGVSVWQASEILKSEVAGLSSQLMKTIKQGQEVPSSSIHILDQYIGRKYGVPSEQGNEAIHSLAEAEGLFTDPIYTGKALAGLMDQVRLGKAGKKHILFWHTGGTPALFTHANSFLRGEEK